MELAGAFPITPKSLPKLASEIESFNKKSLYLLIREMTGHPTHYITKVVNKMKERQMDLYNEYDRDGDIKI